MPYPDVILRYRRTASAASGAERSRGVLAAAAAALALCACGSGQHAKPQSTPFATATPSCNRDASVLDQAQPAFPDQMRGRVHEAQVAIALDIAANGSLQRARVVQSSGYSALDSAALAAADKSTYLPAARHCKPSAGTYIFRVTFSANG